MTSNEHGSAAPNSSQQALGDCDLTLVSTVSPAHSSALPSIDPSRILPSGITSVRPVESSEKVGDPKSAVTPAATLPVPDTAGITSVPSYTSHPTVPVKTKARIKPQSSAVSSFVKKTVVVPPSPKATVVETRIVEPPSVSSTSTKLPPAASLSVPRTWSGFGNQETTYQVLPQVTSLATPSTPYFFSPSSILNWQLTFPAAGGLPTVSAFAPSVSFSQPSQVAWTPSFVTVNPPVTEDITCPWASAPSFVTTTPSASVPTLGVNSEGIFQLIPESCPNLLPKETSGSTFIVSPATLSELSSDSQTMGKTASSTAEAVEGKEVKRAAGKKKKLDEADSKPSTSRSTSKETTDGDRTKGITNKLTTSKGIKQDAPSTRTRRSKTPKMEFTEGEKCEASDAMTNTWYKSKLVEIDHNEHKVKVHFEGWNARYDEWLPMDSERLRPLTGEKFSERPENYSVGDFAIAQVSKATQAGLVIQVLNEKNTLKYVMLFHDGSQKTVTTKGLRRMSPQMREKHEEDLERLTELKKTHPSTLTKQSKTAEADRAVSEEPAETESTYTFDEVDGATTAQLAEPTIAESNANMPSTSEGNVLNTAKKSGKKPGRPPGPAVRGAAPPAELLITSSSKPKRQPKKPSKFNDSVLIGGRKKRKTKTDADETPASGTQTPEPVDEISAEVEKEPVLVTPSATNSGSKKEKTILHASPIKLSKDEAQSAAVVIPLDAGRNSARPSIERVSVPKLDTTTAPSKEKSEPVVSILMPGKKTSSSKSMKRAAEPESAKNIEAKVDGKMEKKPEDKQPSTSQSLPARHSLAKETSIDDDEPTSDQIEAQISLASTNAKKPRKKQRVEGEVEESSSAPSTSATTEEGASPMAKKRSGRPKTIKNLIDASAGEGDWVNEEGSGVSSRTKRPKILAPKELIIRLDHNEFKCNVAECQKSFRKQQLLESHLKHYHQLFTGGLTVEPEEERPVEAATVAAVVAAPKKKKSSTSSLGEGDDFGAATLGMLLSALQPVLPPEPATKSSKLVTAMQHVVIPIPLKTPVKEVTKEVVKEASPPKSPERKSPKKLHDVLQSPPKPSSSSSVVKSEEKFAVVEEKAVSAANEDRGALEHEVVGAAEPPRRKKKTKRERSSLGLHVEDKRSKKDSSNSRRQSFKKQKTSSRHSLGVEAAFGMMGVTPGVRAKWRAEPSSRSKVRSRNEAGDDSETEEVNQYIQNDHELVHCTCGYEMENGFMIQCELCATWQHGHCYGIELESEVPKHYVCDFCRAPKSVRYGQRHASHDLQFLRAGRLPAFTPLEEDEPLQVQNKELYQSLVDDTLHCNDQIRTLRKVSRSLIAAQEAHTKNGLFLSSICKTHADQVKLSNALKNIPESALENLNLEELLEKLVVSNGEAVGENMLDGSDVSLPVFAMNGLPQDFSPVGEAHSTVHHGANAGLSDFPIGELLKDRLMSPRELSALSEVRRISGQEPPPDSASIDNLAEVDQPMDALEAESDTGPKERAGSSEKLLDIEKLPERTFQGVRMTFAQSDLSFPSVSNLQMPTTIPPVPERVESPEFAVIPPRPRNQLNNGTNSFKSMVNGLPGADADPQSPEVYPFTPPSWSPRVAHPAESPEDEVKMNKSANSVEIPSPDRSFEIPEPVVSGPSTAPSAFIMTDIDPDVMALCLEGNLPAILKACNNREDALEKYLDDLEAHMLEMEKACDDKYGTKFAATPQDADKDFAELQKKLNSYQSDLRNLERLSSVVAVKPREPALRHIAVPVPVPAPASTSRSNVTVNDILRPPLPVVIKLNKDGKPRKNAAGLKTSPTSTPAKKAKESGTTKAATAAKAVPKRSESPQSTAPANIQVSSELP